MKRCRWFYTRWMSEWQCVTIVSNNSNFFGASILIIRRLFTTCREMAEKKNGRKRKSWPPLNRDNITWVNLDDGKEMNLSASFVATREEKNENIMGGCNGFYEYFLVSRWCRCCCCWRKWWWRWCESAVKALIRFFLRFYCSHSQSVTVA